METLRKIRKGITLNGLRLGMTLARRGDVELVEGVRRALGWTTRSAWPLRARLRRNMELAGVYRPGLLDEHFARAIDHLMMLAHIFRARQFADSGNVERFRFDDSFGLLEQAYGGGRGVLCIAPHLCGFPVFPPVLSSRIPCSVYLRRNKDPRKMWMNEAAGFASQSELVSPPAGASKARKLQVAIDVLRRGRLMYITPDTPRKSHEGVAVGAFGRTAYFPTGVFVMSLRTGAPVVPAWWHWDGRVYRVRFGQPIELARGRGLREQTEAATRKWAADIDAFLREHPAMWWNWLDKRWTRILRA